MGELLKKILLERKKKIPKKEEFFGKPEEIKEKGMLTPEERKIFENTPEGTILKYLKERFIPPPKKRNFGLLQISSQKKPD